MFMESWILRVSCKVNMKPIKGFHVNFARDPKYSWFHEQAKINLDYLYLHFIIYDISKMKK